MNFYGPKRLADSIRTVRRNTVLIAEDIHEDDYLYRPAAESRSVAEILAHIAYFSRFDRFLHEEEHVTTLGGFDLGKLLRESETQEKKAHTKTKLVDWLKESGETWAQWVEQLSEPFCVEEVTQRDGTLKTRFEMILGTKEHELHHRGQLTVIEGMLGIVPHHTRRRRDAELAAGKPNE